MDEYQGLHDLTATTLMFARLRLFVRHHHFWFAAIIADDIISQTYFFRCHQIGHAQEMPTRPRHDKRQACREMILLAHRRQANLRQADYRYGRDRVSY